MDLAKFEVPTETLCSQCDPGQFKFRCTKDLAPLREFIGQERAMRAVEFGLNMADGYNIYVSGMTGTGRASIVKAFIERVNREREAKGEKIALDDWCYIYNFKDPDRPLIIALPQGKGKQFQSKISDLLNAIKLELGRAFSSNEYKSERQKTIEEGQNEQQHVFEAIANEARTQGFALQSTPIGPALVPMIDNRPMSEQEFLALDDATRKTIEATRGELRKKLRDSLERAGKVQQDIGEKLQKADKDIGAYTIDRLFGPVAAEFSGVGKAAEYMTALRDYTMGNLDVFKGTEEQPNPTFGLQMGQMMMGGRNPYLPFEVNVFVDNSPTKTVPVIVETNPVFGNVFGKIERRFLFGGYLSDHTMLKSGSMSQANGGYLLLDAKDVLLNPGVWPALKRAIRNKEVRIEDPFEQFGLIAPQGMRPEPMPTNVKIILTGDTFTYQLLATQDEDFWEIFKVKADFDHEIERNPQNVINYAAFLAGCCEDCKARPFDPTGVAKIIEYSARMVSDQHKLSSRFAQIRDWVEESEYWAKKDNAQYITAKHVQRAMDERLFRHSLPEEKIREMISEGTIMIDVDGSVIGQLNGLSVHTLGDISFGRPSRITAKTFLGRGGVINIERESQLSGPIHNKGVMILSGYLGWKYAQDNPLSLSASICFEQSYEGVDGDSASSAELYAIVSSISGIPLKQNIAVTGSVNQKGEIQPIGGVNQKIEGFFRVCRARGLTGQQGVLIPASNLRHLMLSEEVVEAVRRGEFHVYSARTVDEGIELLSGTPAGEKQPDGTYPEGTINYEVQRQLGAMAMRFKGFYSEGGKEASR
jgi:predicted ATP-dependent protease